MKSLFLEETTSTQKIIVLVLLSIALTVTDHQSNLLDGFRSTLNVVITPVYYVAELPARMQRFGSDFLRSHTSMMEEIDQLREESLMLRARNLKMASLNAENKRLRGLLGSSEKLDDNVLVAELVSVSPNPDRLEAVIDKGKTDGVFPGQPVLDDSGLMGQVIEVSDFSSRVLLISDDSHSVPVQVNRNNLRLIATGSGIVGELELQHVQSTADIVVGDLLVSSGLGGRFPVGYPVGEVSQVEHQPGEPFARVRARPLAHLHRSRHVLLVFTAEDMSRLVE